MTVATAPTKAAAEAEEDEQEQGSTSSSEKTTPYYTGVAAAEAEAVQRSREWERGEKSSSNEAGLRNRHRDIRRRAAE